MECLDWPLALKPYEVQKKAIVESSLRSQYAFFMEQRLGKTPTILAEFALLVQKGKVDGLVVVVPNSLKEDWLNQANLHLPFAFRGAAWPDIPKPGPEPFVLIMNYESFSVGNAKGVPTVGGALRKYRVMFVLDESTMIKNHSGTRTKNLLGLAPHAAYRRILSGEPMVNGPDDLWSQLRFIDALRSNFFSFRNRYCKMGGFKGKEVIGIKEEMQGELQALLASCSFRARKEEWTDLPAKTYQIRRIGLNPEQTAAYRQMQEEMLATVGDGEISAEMVITQMNKLQQISSGFIMDADGNSHVLGKSFPKTEALREVLEQVSEKVIVFAFYKFSVSWLVAQLADLKPAVLKGGMQTSEIEAEKARFNNDPSCRVIVCQSTSAKYGHTLIGGEELNNRCTVTVFYENQYDYDTRAQSEERNRHPMRKTSNLYIDLCASGQEDKVINALIKKENLARAVIDGVKGRTR